jgi:prolyl-tRNA synthetase
MIVVHGDEKGLRVPPNVAPIQVVIIPIYKSDEEKTAVLAKAHELRAELKKGSIRTKVDDRDEKSPGFKFNEWEVKGIPLRIEIGPKDLEKNQVTVVRRDTNAKEAIALSTFDVSFVNSELQNIQQSLLDQATAFMESHTHHADSMEQMKKIIDSDGGMVWAPWDGEKITANKIKDETKATIRLLGDAKNAKGRTDLFSGKPATEWALFAKAY